MVGILSADSLMNFPDFRAHERAYQLMVQVSGRAGRRDKRGTVILQTTQPEHPLIRMVQHFAYKEMVSLQLSERSMFRYPPYYRLIVLILRSRNEEALQEMSAYTPRNFVLVWVSGCWGRLRRLSPGYRRFISRRSS